MDLPRIGLVDGEEKEIDGLSRDKLSRELVRNGEVLVLEVVGWVPIVIGDLVGNRGPALIRRKHILPLRLLPNVDFF